MGKPILIKKAFSSDIQYKLKDGAGSDAVHTTPIYAYAVCKLATDMNAEGTGLAFTLGTGNNLVCQAIDYLVKHIEGREINELMSNFGQVSKTIADDPNFRWLGPHKGIVHLALASVTNACFDLWAKANGVPLWKLLVSTKKNNKIYLHLLSHPGKNLTLPFPKAIKINKAYFLDGNAQVKVNQDKASFDINLPDSLPDEIASVIVLELNKPAADIEVIERLRY